MYQTVGYLIQYVILFSILAGTVTLMSKRLNITPAGHRYKTLDGARGVCASAVVMIHTCSVGGGYTPSTERLFYLTAGLPVGFFFMLSGFLFFRKTLSGNMNILTFFKNRAKRIYVPVLVVLCTIYIVAFLIGPPLPDNAIIEFITDIPFLYLKFPLGLSGDGYASIGVGPLWTLVWESRLYCAIPLIYWALKPFTITKKKWIIIGVMILIHIVNAYVYRSNDWGIITYFLGGFLVATIEKEKRMSSWVGIVLLIAVVVLTRYAYHSTTALYMVAMFYTIKCGCSYFGFLTSRPVMLLGTCSFSLYIVHSVIRYLSHYYLYSINYYLYLLMTVVISGIVAPLMYYHIERRCIS